MGPLGMACREKLVPCQEAWLSVWQRLGRCTMGERSWLPSSGYGAWMAGTLHGTRACGCVLSCAAIDAARAYELDGGPQSVAETVAHSLVNLDRRRSRTGFWHTIGTQRERESPTLDSPALVNRCHRTTSQVGTAGFEPATP